MESSITVLRVRGIPIGIHWNWLLVFAIVVWSLTTSLFPATYPDLDGTTYLLMAVAAAVLFFGSVLLHELGHALRAQREGLPIQGITLWLLGGIAHLGELPPSPGAEFRVAIWGPSISAVLAASFGLAAYAGDSFGFPAAVQGVVDYVARINATVLAFNLIPALPLDGGRVLRAWLWRRTGSFFAATRSAARAGHAFGVLIISIGLLELFGGGGLGGIWLVFLGWFLVQASQAEGELANARLTFASATERESALAKGRRWPNAGGAPPSGPLPTHEVPRRFEAGEPEWTDGPPVRRAGALVWIFVALAFLTAAAALYHPPYVVISPGQSVDITGDIGISGVPVDPVNGAYLMTSVRISQPSALRVLVATVRTDREVVRLDAIVPKDVDPRSYARSQQEVFRESRLMAVVAAARVHGLPVTVTSHGAKVLDVLPGSPAAKVLKTGDVIVAIDGQPITQTATVGDIIRSRPVGTEVPLAVDREGRRFEATVRSERLPHLSGGVGIGISVTSNGLEADLPFTVRFRDRADVGGPSAGLAYALAASDLLDADDYARGRRIAATGTIDPEGDVGPVGGVKEKAIAVERADARLFIVPASEVDEARREGLTVTGVEKLRQALSLLSPVAA